MRCAARTVFTRPRRPTDASGHPPRLQRRRPPNSRTSPCQKPTPTTTIDPVAPICCPRRAGLGRRCDRVQEAVRVNLIDTRRSAEVTSAMAPIVISPRPRPKPAPTDALATPVIAQPVLVQPAGTISAGPAERVSRQRGERAQRQRGHAPARGQHAARASGASVRGALAPSRRAGLRQRIAPTVWHSRTMGQKRS